MIAAVPRLRTVKSVLPSETGSNDGLAYSLWLPEPASGGVVILHGAGSCKESHHDFARAALPLGLAAIAFDQRGHGESTGPMDGRVIEDVLGIAALLRSALGDQRAPIALRGSSMGGYLAIVAAEQADAAAVVAICPAGPEGLRSGLRSGTLQFAADVPALDAFLDTHDLEAAVQALDRPLLLMHAEGDEQVPVEHSRELAAHAIHPASRLIAVPGGHHRSIQHDDELQAVSLRFIVRMLGGNTRPR
jgi:putative redox protein